MRIVETLLVLLVPGLIPHNEVLKFVVVLECIPLDPVLVETVRLYLRYRHVFIKHSNQILRQRRLWCIELVCQPHQGFSAEFCRPVVHELSRRRLVVLIISAIKLVSRDHILKLSVLKHLLNVFQHKFWRSESLINNYGLVPVIT